MHGASIKLQRIFQQKYQRLESTVIQHVFLQADDAEAINEMVSQSARRNGSDKSSLDENENGSLDGQELVKSEIIETKIQLRFIAGSAAIAVIKRNPGCGHIEVKVCTLF